MATIVDWNPNSQQFIQQNHFDWSAGYGKTPTSLEVLYAQEDLWVLTALVDIIKQTNGDATVRHSAAIKEIQDISIGKYAGGVAGKVRTATSPGAAAATDQESSAATADAAEPAEEPSGPVGEEGELGEKLVDPADLRYVDKDYKPLAAAQLRQAYSGNEADAYLRVAKRMPIRMRLRMDQRKINTLLAECANYKLTVEVRQVRVNPPDAGSAQDDGGGREALRQPSYVEPGGDRREGPGGPVGPPGTETVDMAFPYDVTVEIYGIIYIYNPVDEAILGKDEAGLLADASAMLGRVGRGDAKP